MKEKHHHSVKDCQATTCKRCHKRHHTLLHVEATTIPQAVQVNSTCSALKAQPSVILCTAVIDIIDSAGKSHKCRMLLDSCSESHFLSKRMCNQLGLPTQSVEIPLCGTNAMRAKITECTQTRVNSLRTSYSTSVTFLIAREVSQLLPHDRIDRQSLDIPSGIHLADPNFDTPGEIDGILGGQCFWDIICVGRVVLANQCTKLQKTLLGWIVVGQLPDSRSQSSVTCNLTLQSLHTDLDKFWSIEECPSVSMISPEEQACEDHYTSHTIRDSITGRYTVSLPFNDQRDKLGDTHHVALKRFFALERSFSRNNNVKTQYVEFLKEYERLGHMTEMKNRQGVICLIIRSLKPTA